MDNREYKPRPKLMKNASYSPPAANGALTQWLINPRGGVIVAVTFRNCMNEADCWRIVEQARKKLPNSKSLVTDLVVSKLMSLDAEACIDFHNFLWDRAAQAYHWDLWAAAYIINGGCSDDEFIYFLGWLIANGRTRYYAALANAEVLAGWEFDTSHITCERMLSVGDDAYEAITGQELPQERKTTSWPSGGVPLGETWDVEDLPRRFPKLTHKFNC